MSIQSHLVDFINHSALLIKQRHVERLLSIEIVAVFARSLSHLKLRYLATLVCELR